ncbi:MAG TPA: pantoate--beta-alanine ligase [Spirochaetota bacterium]|nr:pantoate--beta-alanine ligase [Spirochaetota bacterium]
MKVVSRIDDVRAAVRQARTEGKTVGFIPTMGYLHDGHLSLVETSKKNTGFQVMSIFVNRLQFNDKNDFTNYPKDLEHDFAMAEKCGVDLLFTPEDSEMYRNALTTVDVSLLTDNLCGAHRPGHFKGVFTVVSKLFNIVQPDLAVFGQKDIQQAVSIEKMALDLNFPLKIILAPIIREKDGLAMSSRNKHLSAQHRADALVLSASLKRAEDLILKGERNVSRITTEIESIIMKGKPDRIDYISAVRYDDLSYIDRIDGRSVIALAAFWGTTRLIDNMIISREGDTYKCIY